MKVIADTGPLVAAANRRDRAHELAAAIVIAAGRNLVIPTPVLAEIDDQYGDLDLGLTDASVMAVAEREQAPVLTFDFEDFRAAPSDSGPWTLVVDEARYLDSIRGGSPA